MDGKPSLRVPRDQASRSLARRPHAALGRFAALAMTAGRSDRLSRPLAPLREGAERLQGLGADVVLDALGVPPGGLGADAQRAQEALDDAVALPRLGGEPRGRPRSGTRRDRAAAGRSRPRTGASASWRRSAAPRRGGRRCRPGAPRRRRRSGRRSARRNPRRVRSAGPRGPGGSSPRGRSGSISAVSGEARLGRFLHRLPLSARTAPPRPLSSKHRHRGEGSPVQTRQKAPGGLLNPRWPSPRI